VAEHVDDLGIVVVRVLVVAHACAADGQAVTAVLDPLLDQFALVLAGAEAAADRRRRQGRSARAAATTTPGQAVLHAAVGVSGVRKVLDALLDRILGDDDAGVTRRPQALHLRDGDRALVEVGAVLRRDVAPAATRGLRVVGVLAGLLQDLHQLGAAA